MGSRPKVRRYGPLTEQQQVVEDMTAQGVTIACFGLAVLMAAIIVVATQDHDPGKVGNVIALSFAWVMVLTSLVALRIQRALRMVWQPKPQPRQAVCRVCAQQISQHGGHYGTGTAGDVEATEPVDPYVELAERYAASLITLDEYTQRLSQLSQDASGHRAPQSP